MNSFYGRLGLNPLRTSMRFHKIKDGKIPQNLEFSCGTVNIIKLGNDQILENSWGFCDTQLLTVSYAAAVTAYTRIAMHSTLMKVWRLGWKVLYMDTDSVFVSHPGRESVAEHFNIS